MLQSGQMKSDYGWHNNGNGTNSSGFSGLPGGFRGLNGKFFNAGYDGAWWTSVAAIRELHFDHGSLMSYGRFEQDGYSVRCLQDSE